VMSFWSSFGPDAGLYSLFYRTVPIFSFLRAPGRMGVMATLSLIVLASGVAAWLLQRSRRQDLAVVALVVFAIAELTTMPLTQFRQADELSPIYRRLAMLPFGPVVELPYWYERSDFPRHAYYMLNSTAHWQPLINGYSDHIPQDFRDAALPLSGFPSPDSFKILEPLAARYVVVHLDLMDAQSREAIIERLDREYVNYLRPIEKDGDVWLYEIIGWPR
jgi:hypothetical protein